MPNQDKESAQGKETGLSEMNINEQMNLLKSIFESSTEYSIIALDLNGKIVAWNAGAVRTYGYNSSEILGENDSILQTHYDVKSKKMQAILNETLKTGVWTGEMQRLRKDGSDFNSLTTITVRKNPDNSLVGYSLISRDITELQNALEFLKKLKASEHLLQIKNKQLEVITKKAEEANRLKSEFIANVSHEFRTPLNGIIGFAEILHNGLVNPNSEKNKEFLGDIISSAKHLITLINDVLDLEKIEAEKMEFHPIKIDLAHLLNKIKDNFQSTITKKNIHFILKIDPLGDIIIDPNKLRQVFYNYISNALKFTPIGGRVEVCVRPEGKKHFRLEIRDSGIGIHQNDLPKLFLKFQQLDASSKKIYAGTGLGLTLIKHIVEAQGGEVGVESTLNKGSTFYAILPCFPYQKDFIKVKSKKIAKKTFSMPTILVIEQDSIDRTLMIDALTQEGYKVITASTVTKAIKQSPNFKFDAIILDLFQPDMGDWEIIRSLRSKVSAEKAPPIVIKALLEQPISIGFKIHDFLIKPVKSTELLSALEWIGIKPHLKKCVLIIDNDKIALALAVEILTEYGFRVICNDNKISALLSLEKECPDVVLLDPFMPSMDGFEFLRSYRQTERGLFTPVIIWTIVKLSTEERLHLKASIQRVVFQGEDLKRQILAGVGEYLPRPRV